MKMKSDFWTKEAGRADRSARAMMESSGKTSVGQSIMYLAAELAEWRRTGCLLIAQTLKEEEE